MLNRVGASTLPCVRPFFYFLHLLRSLFSSTYKLLLDCKFRMTLQSVLSCMEFLYQKYMFHCVVRCREVNKSGSRDLSFLVAIFNVLGCIHQLISRSKVGLYLDEVFLDGRHYSVQDQAFVD